jgi:hypothetical protein
MLQKNLVYHKSAKGTEAIATRQHGLSPKLRSTLILIDGKRGFEELARLSQALGDTEQLLGQLLEQGFIEEVVGAPAAPAAAPAKSAAAPVKTAAAPATGRGLPLLDAQRYASKRLFAILGVSAEPVCLRIEAARNAQDFQAAIKLAEIMVSDVRSGRVAEEFAAEMQEHMPGA